KSMKPTGTCYIGSSRKLVESRGVWAAHGIADLRTARCNVVLANMSNRPVRIYHRMNVASYDTQCSLMLTTRHDENADIDDRPDGSFQLGPVNDKQKEELESVLKKYEDLFARDPKKPGITSTFTHRIDTDTNRPISSIPYRTSYIERQKIQ